MPPLGLVVSAATGCAEIAGPAAVQAISSLANELAECVTNVRLNARAVKAISERVKEMADVITAICENGAYTDQPAVLSALNAFQRLVSEVLGAVRAQSQQSFLSQLVHRERNMQNLNSLADQVKDSFGILMINLRAETTAMATQLP
ncbi:hypothetical protein AURDEDRAFT_123418 [Auricularia subglabra TFB-10046 SS5]|nr:hypothetical protein AURDEDRAFT_123418 [Auricularia subglabra TFB-10046 SS5]